MSGLDWQKIADPISQASGLIGLLSTNQEKAMKDESHSMVESDEPEQTRDITEPKSVSE